ncbi:MAG: 2-isopropylmalate synthase [Armatimonadetes bacterium]|nr:2-isopropylmalate synthase [Armatimonadota bacterium]
MTRIIKIFDTTLRDGEQCPGASMNAQEKLQIAHQLARLRVDIIEAGFPYSSPGDFESVKQIAREVKGPIIAGLARARGEDIDAAAEAVKYAERPRIHTFIATSDIHLQHKLRKTRDEVLEIAVEAVKRARQHVEDVEFSPEDASRSDLDYLCRVVEAVINAGATTINIPDTVGYATPEEFARIFITLRNRVPGIENITLSTHCHDDLGLGVANSLAAVMAGAGQVECTINGIGERAGNACLEEIVMALRTRHNFFQADTNLDASEIIKMSRLVRDITGFPIPPNKAIVGANAFAHAAGIHQDGVLKSQMTYEIMKPEDVGLDSNRLVLTSRSGRHAFKVRMAALGYDLEGDDLQRAYQRFLEVADKKKEVVDEDLIALMSDQDVAHEDEYELEYLTVMSALGGVPTATVRLRRGEERFTEVGTGVGSVDAVYKTVEKIVRTDHHLTDYIVSAVTGGTDALAEVSVRIARGPQIFTGRSAALDVIEASARAYLQAINKLIYYGTRRSETKRLTAQAV